jgi:ParB family transcriptional regulator, chromosome partitioning protein
MTPSKVKRTFSTAAVTAATAEAGVKHPNEAVPTTQVAPNPRNTRRIDYESPGVLLIKESIEKTGRQIEPSTVVTRTAYLSIFPEDMDEIGDDAVYVQVTGGQRRAACELLSRDLRINVQDELAESRALFVSATADENLKRADLNAIEEAAAVDQIVTEYGSQTAAAQARGWSQPWVSQRLSLLKLAEATKQAVIKHGVPVREVRNSLWKLPEADQLAYVDRLVRMRGAITAVMGELDATATPTKQVPAQRVSPLVRAVQRLHKRPTDEVGETLRAHLSEDERRAWAAELLKGLR